MDRRVIHRDTVRTLNRSLCELERIKAVAKVKREEVIHAHVEHMPERGAKLFAQLLKINEDIERLQDIADECNDTMSLVNAAYDAQNSLKRRAAVAHLISSLRIPDPIDAATKLRIATETLENALRTTRSVDGGSKHRNTVRDHSQAMREVFGEQAASFMLNPPGREG